MTRHRQVAVTQAVIVQLLAADGAVTRVELAKKLSRSISSASKILLELEREGAVARDRGAILKARVGRRADLWRAA